jgi:hypothetical protein
MPTIAANFAAAVTGATFLLGHEVAAAQWIRGNPKRAARESMVSRLGRGRGEPSPNPLSLKNCIASEFPFIAI